MLTLSSLHVSLTVSSIDRASGLVEVIRTTIEENGHVA